MQTAVKRADEQAFARLNGQNLMYVEDAARTCTVATLRWLCGVAYEAFSRSQAATCMGSTNDWRPKRATNASSNICRDSAAEHGQVDE
ncbi:hypothetical protein ALO94_200453 [Pseudomonas syringae pv. spinaceae]|uniref:Uncharacterized protein n=1 Tax=Pseudomonas syringae pv. spinaceae TaxID=264459 RepID=A0A0Q0I4E1_PSESX|nr:hypothetical protein ALO94_200453 [Pseudomonas syringae pv. spinaceae]